ncbi:hypothetical protein ES708_20999 [subsurface metagenome]
MKKLFLIIGILLVFLLTSCGIFNLDSWVLPDDMEFLAVVESLGTPQKIADYMWENFTYKFHSLHKPSPYILWQIKEGDCNDMATFGMSIAEYHGYQAWWVRIYNGNVVKHIFAVYNEGEGLSYMSLWQYRTYFDSFEECVEHFYINRTPDWIWFKVYDYNNNLIKVVENDI